MIARSLRQIMASMQQDARLQYGDDFDVSESSDWYRENMPIAMAFKVAEDKILDTKTSLNLRTASDPYFYEHASNFLFQRKLPTKSKGWCKSIDSVIGAVANIGEIKLRKKGTDIIYKNTSKVTVNSLLFECEFESEIPGEITNAEIGEVCEVLSTPPNFGKFCNESAFAGGQDLETLEESRKRFFNNGVSKAYWNKDGVQAELLRVDGVKSAYVRANPNDTSIDSQPRRSIWCVVEGGRDIDIANAIFSKFTDATFTYGSVRVKVKDLQGVEIEIGFDRPTDLKVDIQVEVLGLSDTEDLKAIVKEYLTSVPVGGVVSNSLALELIPNRQVYKNIDIRFKKFGTSNWVSFIQLGSTEKAVYGVV